MRQYLTDLLLITLTLCFVGWHLSRQFVTVTPAASCGIDLQSLRQDQSEKTTDLILWTSAPYMNCWRAYAPMLAATRVPNPRVQVVPQAFAMRKPAVDQRFIDAAQQGNAPDIIHLNSSQIAEWAARGWLEPIDFCLHVHPEFANIDAKLWRLAQQNGKTWAVPRSFDASILYYNKDKLRQLNWSEERIDGLPERIRRGDWTIDDMFDTIHLARNLSVIRSTEGFWFGYGRSLELITLYLAYGGRLDETRLGKMEVSQTALEETYRFQQRLIAENLQPKAFGGRGELGAWPNGITIRYASVQGKALFWLGSTSDWKDYLDISAKDGVTDLAQHVGMAFFPSTHHGLPGNTILHESEWYAVVSAIASGRHHQSEACAVLAKTLAPDLQALPVAKSTVIGAIKPELLFPALEKDTFTLSTRYLLDDATVAPIQNSAWGWIVDIGRAYLMRVENGELSPEVAAAAAVMQMQQQSDVLVQ